MEIWKDINGFEGLYQVSNLGRVKTTNSWHGRPEGFIRKPVTNFGSYLCVNLSKKSKYSLMTIHRMVAVAFISNQSNKPHVNHKDGDKYNNAVDNLEWVTNQENCRHYWRDKKRPPRTQSHKQAHSEALKEAWRSGKFNSRKPKGFHK